MNKRRFIRQIGVVLLYVLTVLTVAPIFGAAFAQNSSENSGESLTVTEQWAVLNGAFQAGAAYGATTLAEATALRQEVLLVELHINDDSDASGNSSRAGNAYIYDYTTDTLTVATIDLATGQASNLTSTQGVQLPLVQNELDRSALLAMGNTEILEQLQLAYQQQMGTPFTALDQLVITAALFKAIDNPNVVNMQSAECGIHRCALLTIQTDTGAVLTIQPIVDLSSELVVQNVTDPNAIVSPSGDLGFSDTGRIVDESERPELPGASTVPVAAAQPENLGITSPGMIIPEDAVTSPPPTIESAAPSQQTELGFVDTGMIVGESFDPESGFNASTSVAPSQQNNLGVVNTGIISDETDAEPTGQESGALAQDDPNNLGVVDTGIILDESAVRENGQATTLGAAKANIFIPFMARRLFKSEPIMLQMTFEQELFINWWCNITSSSALANEIHGICGQ